MGRFVVTLLDRTVHEVAGADAYLHEGQMTTFFRTDAARQVVDSWATRLFSVRTSEILTIRRVDETVAAAETTRRASVHAPLPPRTAAERRRPVGLT
jgi:hypothetical protein